LNQDTFRTSQLSLLSSHERQGMFYFENIKISNFYSGIKIPFSLRQVKKAIEFGLAYSFSSFFWLDPKEPKGQDLPKLPPHKAERWLAGKSSHRALPINVLSKQLKFKRRSRISIGLGFKNPVISILCFRGIFKTQCDIPD